MIAVETARETFINRCLPVAGSSSCCIALIQEQSCGCWCTTSGTAEFHRLHAAIDKPDHSEDQEGTVILCMGTTVVDSICFGCSTMLTYKNRYCLCTLPSQAKKREDDATDDSCAIEEIIHFFSDFMQKTYHYYQLILHPSPAQYLKQGTKYVD